MNLIDPFTERLYYVTHHRQISSQEFISCLQSEPSIFVNLNPELRGQFKFRQIFIKCNELSHGNRRPNLMDRYSTQRLHIGVNHRVVVVAEANIAPTLNWRKQLDDISSQMLGAVRYGVEGRPPLLGFVLSKATLEHLAPFCLTFTKEIGGHDRANRAKGLHPGRPRRPFVRVLRIIHEKNHRENANTKNCQDHTARKLALLHKNLHEFGFFEYSIFWNARQLSSPDQDPKRNTYAPIERAQIVPPFSYVEIDTKPRQPAQCYSQENGSLRRTSLSRISSAWMYSGWSADTSHKLRDNADSGCFRLTMNSISKKETVALVSQCVRGGQPFRHRERQITKIAVMASALRASRTETFGNPCDGL